MLDQITPLILTRNEEANVARTLGQLAWAGEVVVLDSFSSDRTVTIARGFPNVRIIEREFDSHAAQWSFGLAQVSTPWVLTLDADYFVPQELVAEISNLVPDPDLRGFVAHFRYAVGGRPLRASLYPPRIVLAACDSASFWQDGHTQRLSVQGDVGELRTRIIHDDRKPFGAFMERQRRYMRQEAEKLRTADPSRLNFASRLRKLVVVAPLAVLIHTLFVKGLVFDGVAGIRYAIERFIAELILSRELLRRT